jgi:hypothetical protein
MSWVFTLYYFWEIKEFFAVLFFSLLTMQFIFEKIKKCYNKSNEKTGKILHVIKWSLPKIRGALKLMLGLFLLIVIIYCLTLGFLLFITYIDNTIKIAIKPVLYQLLLIAIVLCLTAGLFLFILSRDDPPVGAYSGQRYLVEEKCLLRGEINYELTDREKNVAIEENACRIVKKEDNLFIIGKYYTTLDTKAHTIRQTINTEYDGRRDKGKWEEIRSAYLTKVYANNYTWLKDFEKFTTAEKDFFTKMETEKTVLPSELYLPNVEKALRKRVEAL